MSPGKGCFITFEGGEGAGKSTQINALSDFLQQNKYDVIVTREPGGTAESEKIRDLLVQRDGGNWTPKAEMLLLFAARTINVEAVIRPALKAGKVVICDRFTDSTRAYQAYGHGLPLQVIDEIDKLVLDGLAPDLTFLLDIRPEEGLERSGARLAEEDSAEDRFEKLEISFHRRLRKGFLEIAKKEPDRCVVIDGSQPVDAISQEISCLTLKKLATVSTPAIT